MKIGLKAPRCADFHQAAECLIAKVDEQVGIKLTSLACGWHLQRQAAAAYVGGGARCRCHGCVRCLVAIDQQYTTNGVRRIAAFDLKAVTGGDSRDAVARVFLASGKCPCH